MIHEYEVFEAVRRGYSELEHSSIADIRNYFTELEPDAVAGHLSNLKGILFEQEYIDSLRAQGIDAEVFGATNHPGTDLQMIAENGEIVELQLKATDSVNYVETAMADDPEIAFVVTTEVANQFAPGLIIDSEIENAALEDAVTDTLLDEVVNPVSPLSILGWIFGLPL